MYVQVYMYGTVSRGLQESRAEFRQTHEVAQFLNLHETVGTTDTTWMVAQ